MSRHDINIHKSLTSPSERKPYIISHILYGSLIGCMILLPQEVVL